MQKSHKLITNSNKNNQRKNTKKAIAILKQLGINTKAIDNIVNAAFDGDVHWAANWWLYKDFDFDRHINAPMHLLSLGVGKYVLIMVHTLLKKTQN